jgi:hypothetical protein
VAEALARLQSLIGGAGRLVHLAAFLPGDETPLGPQGGAGGTLVGGVEAARGGGIELGRSGVSRAIMIRRPRRHGLISTTPAHRRGADLRLRHAHPGARIQLACRRASRRRRC